MGDIKNNAKLAKKINEVCSCTGDKYCLLKEILLCSHNSPRFLVQLKCIEMAKYELSQEAGNDIGWETAHIEWVSKGWAKIFAEIYTENEDLPATQIYKKIKEKCKAK